MSSYRLEPSEYLYRLTCECCGTEKNRVWGFILKDGDANAVYYALLNVSEGPPCRANAQRGAVVGRY
jgi:hypothetical protein